MSRRGIRSWPALRRREADALRHYDAHANGVLRGVLRWESKHGEGTTSLTALCVECSEQRRDVTPQSCNARHPDGRLRAEALMLAVASYGSCQRCGATAVQLVSQNESWMDALASDPDERGIRRRISSLRG